MDAARKYVGLRCRRKGHARNGAQGARNARTESKCVTLSGPSLSLLVLANSSVMRNPMPSAAPKASTRFLPRIAESPTAPAHFSRPNPPPPQREHKSVARNAIPPRRTHIWPPESRPLHGGKAIPSPESRPLHGGSPNRSPETHSLHGGTPFQPPEMPFLHGGMGSWNMWNDCLSISYEKHAATDKIRAATRGTNAVEHSEKPRSDARIAARRRSTPPTAFLSRIKCVLQPSPL